MKVFSSGFYIPVCRFLVKWTPCFLVSSSVFLCYWIWEKLPLQEQGEVFKLMYVHVPTAIMSMVLFFVMGIMSVIDWVRHIKIARWIASIVAKWGLFCTFVALVSGSIWSRYAWGGFWVWDARLTTELMLFFLYLAYCLADKAVLKYRVSKKVLVVIAIIGMLDIPLVHYSVEWWYSLHQKSTLLHLSKHAMSWDLLWPLLACMAWLALLTSIVIANGVLKRAGIKT